MEFHWHRKEQWDLECWPIICLHVRTANAWTRWFCLWRWGIQVGNWYWPRPTWPKAKAR